MSENLPPSCEVRPIPDLPALVIWIREKWYPVKSPHVSEPNISALQQLDDSFESVTVTSPFWKCLPSAKSLLNPSASSLAWMSALVMVTCCALMTFQPSRLLAVRIVRWSDLMLSQPLVIIAKWPPDLRVTPLTVRPSQRVIEISLSDLPDPTLSPVTSLPAPSMVPEPMKPTFVTLSPRITASLKWLCP